MRLHHSNDFTVSGFSRRLQYRRDLDGMMAVIIDDGDAIPLAGPGKAPPDAAEACDRLSDDIVRKPQFMRDSNSGDGVQGVVTARHWQMQVANLMRHLGLAIAE